MAKMKKYASVFSWLGGGFHAAYSIVSSIVGKPALAESCNKYNECKVKLILEPYPSYVLYIMIAITVINLCFLIWREQQVNRGKKIAYGVVTLLFCSLVGGILTLCIPQDELDDIDPRYKYKNKR